MVPRAAALLVLVPVAAVALAGCGYSTCGTMQYTTQDRVDARFDRDADGDIDLIEACGSEYGSFGVHYTTPDLYTLHFDSAEWEMSDAADVAYDYLPVTEAYFRGELLQKGAVLTEAEVGGYGFHKPAGNMDAPTVSWRITDLELEVLDGPVADDFSGVNWKLRWRIVVGTPGVDGPQGAQLQEGEDWVNFYDDAEPWNSAGHAGNPPGYPRG